MTKSLHQLRRAVSFFIEAPCNELAIQPLRGQLADALAKLGIVTQLLEAGDGPDYDAVGSSAAGPLDADPDPLTVPFHLYHCSFDDLPHDLLAFGVGGAGRSPQRRDVGGQPANGVPFRGRKQPWFLGEEPLVLFL